MKDDLKESSPTNSMGTSSSIQGTGGITGFDPLMGTMGKKFTKKQLKSFRSVTKNKRNPNRPKPPVKRHKQKLVKQNKNRGVGQH